MNTRPAAGPEIWEPHPPVLCNVACIKIHDPNYKLIKSINKAVAPKYSTFVREGLLPLNRAKNYCLRLILSWELVFGLAKIIRQAAVCNTLVTRTSTVSPIKRLPPSTTIIVPSSR